MRIRLPTTRDHRRLRSSECVAALPVGAEFQIVDVAGKEVVYRAPLSPDQTCDVWFPNKHFYRAVFSPFQSPGTCFVQIEAAGDLYQSGKFAIGEQELEQQTFPAMIEFYRHQRADSPEELAADKHVLLFGSQRRVDLHGGWCDASGDVSKYFSHLAYTNFMSPQQTPLVVWSMANAVEQAGPMLEGVNGLAAMQAEAVYGADYLLRSLAPDGYFYMTVFSYFNKDPEARRVVGLLADSKTTADYQCAYREGGGMAIAALARISRLQLAGEFSADDYLSAAERAFTHLESNNLPVRRRRQRKHHRRLLRVARGQRAVDRYEQRHLSRTRLGSERQIWWAGFLPMDTLTRTTRAARFGMPPMRDSPSLRWLHTWTKKLIRRGARRRWRRSRAS